MPDLRRLTPLLVLLAIGLAIWLVPPTPPGGGVAPRSGRAYAPVGDAPADAIPGGSLRAHEGLAGAHTVERHVGRSLADLRARAEREGLREVSTWPDLATADRAVAQALFRARVAIQRWLGASPRGLQDFEARLDAPSGTVWRRSAGRAVEGRTVVVVLAATDRFPEGFRIHTAYLRTP